MNRVVVDLKDRSYPIYIGRGTLSNIGKTCGAHDLPRKLAVVTDRNVAGLYLRPLRNALRHHGYDVTEIIIPPGERQKSLSGAGALFTTLVEADVSRTSGLLAFGGGVVGDLSGFAAATFRRGIPLVHVPTTLLAQIESAIGGKVAVNHAERKNVIGAFYQPTFVFSDVQLLSSLPKREVFCGLGELLKYAYLSEELFGFIDEHLDGIIKLDVEVLQETIMRCNAYKALLVAEDERELNPAGGRMVLNLGHTIGHALESLSGYSLHHGEAILVGLRWEVQLARRSGLLPEADFERIHNLLRRVDFQPKLKSLKLEPLIKKILGKNGKARFFLPKRVGEVVSEELGADAIRSLLGKKKW